MADSVNTDFQKKQAKQCSDLLECSRYAADVILEIAQRSVKGKGRFLFVLSGGTTPQTLYTILAEESMQKRFPWEHTFIFWGDERCVPIDHPDSNFLMAYTMLIEKVPIPSGNIFRIPVENNTPEKAAKEYELTLRDFFSIHEADKQFPVFDLILLGTGCDGHTASLFPGSQALQETQPWAVSVHIPSHIVPALDRVTLTLPVINNAENVIFIVAGQSKKKIVQEIFKACTGVQKGYPAALVHPQGKLFWFISEN